MALVKVQEGVGNSAANIEGMSTRSLPSSIPAEMNLLMDRVNAVGSMKIQDPARGGHKALVDAVSKDFENPEAAHTDEIVGMKFNNTMNTEEAAGTDPSSTGNITHKMMAHYIRMVEIICKLKAAKLDGINELMNKVNEAMENQCFWTTGQGWSKLATGFGGGALKIGASFLGDSSVAKVMDGVSQFFPYFSQTTETFMQSYSIPHELAKNMILNIKLPQANEKMRGYGEVLKEANQHLEQLMQLMKQAKTKINQG